jgi:CRP-like cAMP-binding protein
MDTGALGRVFKEGETIIRQGDAGECMFVIQEGKVEILIEKDSQEVSLAIKGEGDFIGEMAIFDRDVRSATIRALEETRVITVDKKNFLRRISQDPSLAFRIIETMSQRIRTLNDEVARLSGK